MRAVTINELAEIVHERGWDEDPKCILDRADTIKKLVLVAEILEGYKNIEEDTLEKLGNHILDYLDHSTLVTPIDEMARDMFNGNKHGFIKDIDFEKLTLADWIWTLKHLLDVEDIQLFKDPKSDKYCIALGIVNVGPLTKKEG